MANSNLVDNRYIPANTNQGWGIISLVLLLTAALIVSVAIFHKKTYRHPTDVTWHGVESTEH